MEKIRIEIPKVDIRDIIPGEDGQKIWDAVKKYRFGNPLSDEEKDAVCMLLVPYLAKAVQFRRDYADLCFAPSPDRENPDALAYFARKYGIPVDGIEARVAEEGAKYFALRSPIIILWDAYGEVAPPAKYFDLAYDEAARLGFALEECSDAEREVLLAKYDIRKFVPGPDGEKVWSVICRKASGKPVSAEEMEAAENLLIPANAEFRRRSNDFYELSMDDVAKRIRPEGIAAFAEKYHIAVENVDAFVKEANAEISAVCNVIHLFWDEEGGFLSHIKKFRV